MHPEITNEDIVYAEHILFGERGKFDWERKEFIKNLDTVDLQAVPGSGKTTALLAKLIILQRYQPFSDEAGILVLSHTNKAVDLIKERIGLQCPNLFQYPNYVGTIQSFVDQFLAKKYLQQFKDIQIKTVDSELYQNRIYDKYRRIEWVKKYGKPGGIFWARNSDRAEEEAERNKTSVVFEREKLIEKEVKQLFYSFEEDSIKKINDNEIIISNSSNEKFISLKNIILEVLNEGIISYEYAYPLAGYCINIYPRLIKILQKRFRYVFVDEMQDMESHQVDILERLFRKKKTLKHTYQRIGDNNQAIFSGLVHENAIWENINNVKKLTRSLRLSSETAKAVEPFSIIDAEIIGSNEEVNTNPLPPHLLVFDDKSVTDVIPAFAKLITQYQNGGSIPKDRETKFKAVGWIKENETEGRLAIKDYFPWFNLEVASSSSNLNCLEDFIFRAEQVDTSKAYHSAILDAILNILRMEKVKIQDGKYFSKRSLFKFIREHEDKRIWNYYDRLLLKLYQLCSICIKEDVEILRSDFHEFILELLSEVFGKENLGDKAISFINDSRIPDSDEKPFYENNTYTEENVSIEVGTVHSVKGETHCATLYLESYYRRSYESKRLINQLKGTSFDDERPVYKQSTKVAYVGLSRATHLACFAAHEGRVQKYMTELSKAGWEIEIL